MISLVTLSVLASFYHPIVSAAPTASDSLPICIVGAGPTGLTVAHELEAKKIPIFIFEKQSEVGGKCQTFYDGPNGSIAHPLGAILIVNSSYTSTFPIVKSSGIRFQPSPGDLTGGKSFEYPPLNNSNFAGNDVKVTKTPSPTPDQISAINAEVQKYNQYWQNTFAPKYSKLRYTGGIPKELTVPFGQWLSDNGYQILPTVVSDGLTTFGYGDLSDTPAIYMLQYFTPDILAYFAGSNNANVVDFHKVMLAYARTISGKIMTGVTVSNIDRSSSHPVITYVPQAQNHASTPPQKQSCSSIVLAFPPVLSALQPTPDASFPSLNMTLTSAEKSVFSRVSITSYYSGAISLPSIPYPYVFTQTPAESLAQPVLLFKLSSSSDVANIYSWGNSTGGNSTAIARGLMKKTLGAINFGSATSNSSKTTKASPLTEKAVQAFQGWDYFPHFDSGDLAAGIYDQFNALQGQHNTYWASGLNGFETVEFAVRAGKDLVESFF
ncbi:hypothetical protein D9758_016007 [Tetrapyrgos nigripes]|uniref:FAD/NAD(P)-binding domain-containing protein n=1 Tax=Tetrapyrgos nigripes TaxID=182062 RepID=A0A8H5FNA7_9AGAR|nr:hypothetical protein D9758_016007 [Tetrapyrgos nigripes]